jgi:hypothetical protein
MKNFTKMIVTLFLLLVFVVVNKTNSTTYASPLETPDTTPIKPIPHVTFKMLPNGVSVRTIRFSADPRLLVPKKDLMVFRVYVYKNDAIALTWENGPLSLDPFSVMQGMLPNILKSMHNTLLHMSKYRFISVMDYSSKNGVSGAYYSPTLFPAGMTSLDLKW